MPCYERVKVRNVREPGQNDELSKSNSHMSGSGNPTDEYNNLESLGNVYHVNQS